MENKQPDPATSNQVAAIWWQDRVGWGGGNYSRSCQQRWLDESRSEMSYPDLDGKRVWTVLTTTLPPGPICGLSHPDKDPEGQCVMPQGHRETPHVWGWGDDIYVLSLTSQSEGGIHA